MITDHWLTTAIVIRIVMLTHIFRAAMVAGCQITICRIRAGTGMLTMSFAVGF